MPDDYKNMWWAIDGFLAGMGIPYIDPARRYNLGGDLMKYDDDLPLIYNSGIRAIVCLLNIPGDLPVFETAGFEFRCFPTPDGHPPAKGQAVEFVNFADSCRLRNLPVAVFCEAGAGRTGTMICCYLIHTGMTAAAAIAHARTQEPSAVETLRQIVFLEEFEKQPLA
jgi:Dual specificity phosphatase, catalytic domain